jgi:hypothetical protein
MKKMTKLGVAEFPLSTFHQKMCRGVDIPLKPEQYRPTGTAVFQLADIKPL